MIFYILRFVLNQIVNISLNISTYFVIVIDTLPHIYSFTILASGNVKIYICCSFHSMTTSTSKNLWKCEMGPVVSQSQILLRKQSLIRMLPNITY